MVFLFLFLFLFLSLAHDAENPTSRLRWQISQFNRATQAALQGLQCAFPEDIAQVGTQQAIAHVLDACSTALIQCFPTESSTEVMDAILDSINKVLQSYLVS